MHVKKYKSKFHIMKIIIVFALLGCIFMFTGCSSKVESAENQNMSEDTVSEDDITQGTFVEISQEEAKNIIDSEEGYIILDVREQEEYDEGHIPGAVVMPYESAKELASEILPYKDQTILIYCRSGRRSKIAAQTLADMGYADIREFGGIIDWPYEIEK